MTPQAPRGMSFALLGSALLVIAGAAAFVTATQHRPMDSKSADQIIEVTATGCQPNQVTLPGGRRRFEIVNASDRTIEWEILKDVFVLAERENIAPGFRSQLEVPLAPGDYQMTCGLLSTPRGQLTVTASDEASAAASNVTLRAFLGPLSEYKVYVALQSKQAVTAAQALQAAITAQDLSAAQQAWVKARLFYRRIEPVAQKLSDLENAIDPQAAYLTAREEDAGFTGYHRLEYQLFGLKSLNGAEAVAQALVQDLEQLSTRLKAMPLTPQMLVALPQELAAQLAQGVLVQGENPYSQTDLPEIAASFEGLSKLIEVIAPIISPAAPDLSQRITQKLTDARADLVQITASNPPSYAHVQQDEKSQLISRLNDLSASLLQIPSLIGGL